MRMIGAGLLALVALFCVLGLAAPFVLATRDRVYYEQFRQAVAYIEAARPLPAEVAVEALRKRPGESSIWSSLSCGCDASFIKRSDRLILSFWRGERGKYECYAYPSGRTTLPMSVTAYLSDLAFGIAGCLLMALAAGWGATRLMRGK